jgi:hypothetical protein
MFFSEALDFSHHLRDAGIDAQKTIDRHAISARETSDADSMAAHHMAADKQLNHN